MVLVCSSTCFEISTYREMFLGFSGQVIDFNVRGGSEMGVHLKHVFRQR